ncbi:hypothetical protein [Phaeodactylibacter xiamenensis]|uniref:hypothetical protein n=1 Tax=Phaeodactylibacter xiamenensis TaxID=1524460 RepID=UPI003BAA82D4
MNLKSFLLTLGWVGSFLCLFEGTAIAQITGNLKDADDPAVLTLNLAPLSPLEGTDVPQPYRQLFLIFNDGQFYTADEANTVFQQSHGFDGATLGGATAEAVVFSKAIYSDEDGDPPPKIVSGTGPTVAAATPDKTKAVPDTALIAITPDHPALIPNGRTVLTVSVKNDSNGIVSAAAPYNGYLLLFHESKLTVETARRLKKKGAGVIEKLEFSISETDAFIEQSSEMPDLPNALRLDTYDAVDLSGTSSGNTYRALQVFRVSGLQPGQEQHFFLPVFNRNVHYDSIPEGGSGAASYAAVLLLEPGNFSFPQLSAEEAEGVSKLNLSALLEQGIPLATLGDPSGTLTLGELQPAAYTSAMQSVRRSYDPNLIELWACACPDTSLAGQKLLIKVAFENEGAGATGAVKVRIPLPAAVDVASISDQELFSVAPGIETFDIEKDTAANTLTVTFPKLRLAGTSEHKSLAARSGYFSFLAYTRSGTDIGTLPPTQACIAFRDENAPPDTYNSEVCTPRGTVTLIDEAGIAANDLALSCTVCEVKMAEGITVLGMPLWLFLLLLVVVIGAILLAFYSDDWLG